MTIEDFVSLYHQCQKEIWSDEAPTLEYFVDWLDSRKQQIAADSHKGVR